MTPEEARKELLDKNKEDIDILRDILTSYQHETGIGWTLFCDQLFLVAQELRLITTLLGSGR